MPDFFHGDAFIANVNSLVYTAPLVFVLYDTQGSNLNSDTYTEATDVAGTAITITGHGFGSAGDYFEVQFTPAGTLDTALVAATTYVGRVIDANTISVADSYANARLATYITLNDDGTGVTTVDEQPVSRFSEIEYIVRKEVANAFGYARQTITLTGSFSQANLRAELEDLLVTVTASGGAIITSGGAIFRASDLTYGSTTGEAIGHTTWTAPITINDGTPQTFPVRLNNMNKSFVTTGD